MKRTNHFSIQLTGILLVCLLLAGNAMAESHNFKLKDGDTIVFLGDSITQAASKSEGYISLIKLFCGINGYDIETINAGIGGHKSNDMLDRLDNDVLKHNPDWVSVSCGVNDVWHQFEFDAEGVPLEDYKKNITAIVEKCQQAGAKVLLNTATPIYENLDSEENQKLRGYNEFLRQLAQKKDLILADQFGAFEELIRKKLNDERLLTTDGVHMNPRGNRLMARTILSALGMSGPERRRAENRWELVNNLQPMGK